MNYATDAARLKGCWGSRFRQKLLPEVQGVPPPFEELRLLGGFFRFWRSLYRPVDPGSSPLDPENVEFSPFKPFSGQIAPFSRSKKPPRDRPEGADRAGAGGFPGGVLEQATEPLRTAKGKGVSV